MLELIRIYAEKEIDYTVDRVTRSTLLDDADAYLIERGFAPLPNCNLQKEGRGSGTLDTSKQVEKEYSSFQNCTHTKKLIYPQKSLRGALSPLRKSIQQTAVTRTRSLLSKAHQGKKL